MRAHMLARAHAHHHHRPGTIACTIPPIIAAKDMHMTIHPAFTYRPFFNIFRKKKKKTFLTESTNGFVYGKGKQSPPFSTPPPFGGLVST